jgi:O-antigen ligase
MTSATQDSRVSQILVALLAIILLIGGAGSGYPALTLATSLISIWLAILVFARFGFALLRNISRIELMILLLLVATPLAQLIPLPIGFWTRLPGRDLPQAVLGAAGLHPASMPFSLAPHLTLACLFAMMPGLTLFAVGRSLLDRERLLAAKAIVAVAMLSACLGALQVVIGEAAYPFATTHAGFGIGIFVNRNHQAALLLVAICLASAFRPEGKEAGRFALWIAMLALLAAGVLGTTSRTALVILPFCLLFCAHPRQGKGYGWPIVLGVAISTLAAFAWSLGALDRSFARFGREPELRMEFWHTTWGAAQHYWPLGSGLGSFASIYPLFETREQLVAYTVNNAHNDYLELLLEGGIASAVGLLLFFGWLAKQLWTIRQPIAAPTRSTRSLNLKPAILAGLLVLLAFSFVDYPMRMASLMALFGLSCGILGPQIRQGIDGAARTGSRWRLAACAATGLLLSAGILLYPGQVTAAFDPLAGARVALQQGRFSEAANEAKSALLRNPTDAATVTLLALAERAAGHPDPQALLAVASRLGWRDAPTQTWLFSQAADHGDNHSAALRLDALLRTQQLDASLAQLVRGASGQGGFSESLTEILAANPPWRRGWLTKLAGVDRSTLRAQAVLLERLAATRSGPTTEEIAALVSRAQALHDDAVAAHAWSLYHETAGGNALPDPRFRDIDRSPNARNGIFGWHRTDLDGLSFSQLRSEDPASFVYDGAIAGPLLYQDLWLPPGRYALRWRTIGESNSGDTLVTFTMRCADAAISTSQSQEAAPMLIVEVPQNCPHQRLQLVGSGTVLDGVPSEFRVVGLGIFRT